MNMLLNVNVTMKLSLSPPEEGKDRKEEKRTYQGQCKYLSQVIW